jgi:hypothetical protein
MQTTVSSQGWIYPRPRPWKYPEKHVRVSGAERERAAYEIVFYFILFF